MSEETTPKPMPVSWWRDLRLAMGFMTRLPVGAVEGDLAAASWAFPLAGLLVGGVAALIYGFAIDLGLSALIAAALAVASGLLLTGALHEDGLALSLWAMALV